MKASEFDLLNIEPQERKAVLLQSGGLDSYFLACLLQYYDFEIHHIFIDYGQNSVKKELESAEKIVSKYGGSLHKVTIDLPWLKDVCLLNGGVAKSVTSEEEVYLGGVQTGIYVPMRNLLFIGIASSYAEAYKIPYIATGIDGMQDKEGNPLHGTPDKHPNFAIKLEQALTESSSLYHIDRKKFEILCPIIGNEKIDTVRVGLDLGCDFTDSWTCYNSTEKPCLACDSCLQRLFAFEALGVKDPTVEKYYGKYDSVNDLPIKSVTWEEFFQK